MTTAAHTTPRALTAYLRRATWGLPEARRQELWDELEEHLLTRADHLILTGLTPTQATAQALRELGPPARVTLGMAKVYTMPKLLIAAGTLALALSAALHALAGGGNMVLKIPIFEQPKAGQLCVADVPEAPSLNLPVLSRSKSRICYQLRNTLDLTGAPAMISVSSAAAAMKVLGGSISVRQDGKVELRRPNGTYGRSEFAFNDGTQNYIFAATLFNTLISTRGREDAIVLQGFAQPTMTINSTTFQLVGAQTDSVGNNIYGIVVSEAIAAVLFGNSDNGFSFETRSPFVPSPRHVIRTNLLPDEVVVLLTQSGPNSFVSDYAPVARDGTLSLRSTAAQLRFVNTRQALTAANGPGTPAMLVRISGVPLNNLQSGIFLPAQATSDAR